jgi:O-antigen/teichoic acid export membrane protein
MLEYSCREGGGNLSAKEVILAISPTFLRTYADRIEKSPLLYRFAKGSFWVIAGSLSSRFLSMISAIVVTRMLGKVHYGELGIIDGTVAMMSVFASFGLGATALKYVAEFRAKDQAKAGRVIALSEVVACITGGTMAMVLIIFAPWLSEYTLKAPHLASLLRVGAGIIFLEALIAAQGGVLSGLEAFKAIAQRNAILGLLTLPLMVGGAYCMGVEGAVWALFVSSGVKWLLNYFAVKNELSRFGISPSYSGMGQELNILWGFSLPVVLQGVVVGPVNWLCSTMLVRQPNGYGEMGVFNAANQWFNATMFLPGLLGQVVLPLLCESCGRNDQEQSKSIMALSMKVNFVIVLPFIITG